MLFQWSCPAQLLLDGDVKKTKNTQANCDCFISAAPHCKDVISQLAEGKAKECLCQPGFSQWELQIHLEIFFLLTYGPCLLDTVSL